MKIEPNLENLAKRIKSYYDYIDIEKNSKLVNGLKKKCLRKNVFFGIEKI